LTLFTTLLSPVCAWLELCTLWWHLWCKVGALHVSWFYFLILLFLLINLVAHVYLNKRDLFYFIILALAMEHKALYLLGKCSTTWVLPPVLFLFLLFLR
jgi:hypothetical protein